MRGFLVVLLLVGAVDCGGGPGAEDVAQRGARIFELAKGEESIAFVHSNGMTGENFFVEMMGGGAALFDADGDGDLDAYLTQGRPLGPSAVAPELSGGRLFKNLLSDSGKLSWEDVTQGSGLVTTEYGTGVAVGDIDNDGDLDLYLTNFGPNELFVNDGTGRFEKVARAGGASDSRWSASAAFLDYDGDGFLDLYVTNYVDFTVARPRVCSGPSGRPDYCSPNSYRGEPDALFHNLGDGNFEDVTVLAGIASKYGNGLGVVTADFDADGLVDIYVANDLEANLLWLNQGDGTFVNEAMLFGIAVNADGKAEAGMGLVAADLDNDGDEDIYLTHLTGETNTLYENQGGGLFLDVTQSKGLALPSVSPTGFGVVAVDVDNDGRLDLVVANGAVTVVEEQALAGSRFPLVMANQIFLQGDGGFSEQPLLLGEEHLVSRGIAAGDVDNDGDTDLLVMNNNGPAQLLLNQVGESRNWVGLSLIEPTANGMSRSVYGATVRLELNVDSQPGATALQGKALRLRRRVTVEGGYLSSHDARVLIGLGEGSVEGPLVAVVCWRQDECEQFSLAETREYHPLVRGKGSESRPKD